jgi:hypothetical protein
MPYMNIILDAENAWPDLKSKPADQVISVDNFHVAMLAGGMASGAASVAIRIDLPDGRTVIAQTSQALWDSAARAFRGRLEFLAGQIKGGGRPS